MDAHHEFACDGEFARELIEHLAENAIDIGACAKVSDPETHGFGHAYGFVVTRLMAKLDARIVPVLLNTYYPPNQPTPARCYAIGRAIRFAINASKLNRRVAVVASGGLSHFVTNEELDHRVIDALKTGDPTDLCRLPVEAAEVRFLGDSQLDRGGRYSRWRASDVARICAGLSNARRHRHRPRVRALDYGPARRNHMSKRRSIEVEGFGHGATPIPAASRIGNMIASGGIAGLDTATGKIAGDLEAQVIAMFANVRKIVEAGGGTHRGHPQDDDLGARPRRARDHRSALDEDVSRSAFAARAPYAGVSAAGPDAGAVRLPRDAWNDYMSELRKRGRNDHENES